MDDSQHNWVEVNDPSRRALLGPTDRQLPVERDTYDQINRLPGYADQAVQDDEIDLLEYARLLLRNIRLIATAAGVGLLLAILWTLVQTPIYTAEIRLQIDAEAGKIIEAGDIMPSQISPTAQREFLTTQFKLLQSRSLAESVIDRLGLSDNKDFVKTSILEFIGQYVSLLTAAGESDEQASASSSSSARAEKLRKAVKKLSKNIQIAPVRGARLVDVKYSDTDPKRAAKIANEIGDQFKTANLDKRFESSSSAKTFLEDQIRQLKARLKKSEQGLIVFAEKNQIVTTSDRTSIVERRLSELTSQLNVIVGERVKNERRWKQVESEKTDNFDQFLSDETIEELSKKRNELSAEYLDKLSIFKPDYPAMIQLRKKISVIDSQIANEVAKIKSSLKSAYELSLQKENLIKREIGTLETELLSYQKRSIQYNVIKRDVDTNRKLYQELLTRHKEISVASGAKLNNIFIIDRAVVPIKPSSPKLLIKLLIGFALAFAAGVVIAMVKEYLDDTINTPEDLEKISGLPVLGILPKLSDDQDILEVMSDPRSHLSEAYRSFATSLQFSTEKGLPKTILFTSSEVGEGKSTSALTIAKHFATMGLKVLIVDCDLRSPSLHLMLQISNNAGLSNYLTSSVQPPEIIQPTQFSNLSCITSGPLPPNAADLLSGSQLHTLLSIGSQVFDLIVLDGPPVMGLADAPLLSSPAEATVFVTSSGMARASNVGVAIRRLNFARGRVIGSILTMLPEQASGYGYGYGYGYGNDAYSYGTSISNQNEHSPKLVDQL